MGCEKLKMTLLIASESKYSKVVTQEELRKKQNELSLTKNELYIVTEKLLKLETEESNAERKESEKTSEGKIIFLEEELRKLELACERLKMKRQKCVSNKDFSKAGKIQKELNQKEASLKQNQEELE